MSLRISLAAPKYDKNVIVQCKRLCYFSAYVYQKVFLCLKEARIYEKNITMERSSKKY